MTFRLFTKSDGSSLIRLWGFKEDDKSWRQGRAFLIFNESRQINFEWSLFRRVFGVGVDSTNDLGWHVQLPGLGSFFWSIAGWLPRRWQIHDKDIVNVYVHGGALWWRIWQSKWDSKRGPWWRYGHFDPRDFFLGRQKYSREIVKVEPCHIPMYEATYTATATWEASTWKRPRWPFKKTRKYIDLSLERPPAFPGKGENSWDIGDDGIYGMSVETEQIEEAIAGYVKATLKNLRRYGGSVNWQSKEIAPS